MITKLTHESTQSYRSHDNHSFFCRMFSVPAFLSSFLTAHSIDPSIYSHCATLPRFIRVNPRNPITLEELNIEFSSVHPHKPNHDSSNCPDSFDSFDSFDSSQKNIVESTSFSFFFKLPNTVSISSTPCYQSGRIYGMDLSSGICVYLLNPNYHDSILDLCCAPGAKLCMIYDEMNGQGILVGVEIQKERLAACKSMIRKYQCENVRLEEEDGRWFNLGPNEEREESWRSGREKKKKKEKEKRKGKGGMIQEKIEERLTKEERLAIGLRKVKELTVPEILYDKVLADVECSHDGSLRHMAHYFYDKIEPKKTCGSIRISPEYIDELFVLQRLLLFNAFRLVKPGGRVIYSTCSFSKGQNEEVVSWLLKEINADTLIAVMEPFSVDELTKFNNPSLGSLEGCVNFSPIQTETSALFVARIKKVDKNG